MIELLALGEPYEPHDCAASVCDLSSHILFRNCLAILGR